MAKPTKPNEFSPLTPIDPELRYSAQQTASMLGVATGTLSNWRIKGIGPSFIRYSARSTPWYLGKDISDFINSNRVQTTGESQ